VTTGRPARDDRIAKRQKLLERLLNPDVRMCEAAVLLGVCEQTLRRYVAKGKLKSFRSAGGQRRFLLADVLEFIETYGSAPDRKKGNA